MRAIDTTGSGFDSASVKRLVDAGVGIVIGYVHAGGSWKHLTRDQADAYRKAGIGLAFVCEPGDAEIINDDGAALARGSKAAIKALGGPDRPFVWFGQDNDSTNTKGMLRVLDAAATVLGKNRVGIYGNGTMCKAAIKAGYRAWQAQSPGWPGSGYHDASGWHQRPVAGIALLQLLGQPYGDLGMDYDGNTIYGKDGYIGQETVEPPAFVRVWGSMRAVNAFAHEVGSSVPVIYGGMWPLRPRRAVFTVPKAGAAKFARHARTGADGKPRFGDQVQIASDAYGRAFSFLTSALPKKKA